MFTGLIGDIGELIAAETGDAGKTLRISTSYPLSDLKPGVSIACAGICLTVTAQGSDDKRNWFCVEASPETLVCTTLGSWSAGDKINLERPLKLGDALGGHIVTGHVAGTAQIASRIETDAFTRFVFEMPQNAACCIAAKGSIALDGTSLTVNGVQGKEFDVMLIPHTLRVTTWAARQAGDRVNLEADVMARYAARILESSKP